MFAFIVKDINWSCETFSTQYMFLLCCVIHTVNLNSALKCRNRHCSIYSPTNLHQPSGYNPFPSTFYSLPEGTMRTKLVNGHSSWMLCCNAWWEIMWVVAEVCHCFTIRSPDGTACTMQPKVAHAHGDAGLYHAVYTFRVHVIRTDGVILFRYFTVQFIIN
jgi:hypothetical protein